MKKDAYPQVINLLTTFLVILFIAFIILSIILKNKFTEQSIIKEKVKVMEEHIHFMDSMHYDKCGFVLKEGVEPDTVLF